MKIQLNITEAFALSIKQANHLEAERLKALEERRKAEAEMKNEQGRTVRGGKARFIAAAATYDSVAKIKQVAWNELLHMVSQQVNEFKQKHIADILYDKTCTISQAAADSIKSGLPVEVSYNGHNIFVRTTWSDYSGVRIEVGFDKWHGDFTIDKEDKSMDYTRSERRTELLKQVSESEIEFGEEAKDGNYTVGSNSLRQMTLAEFRFKVALASNLADIAQHLSETSYANAVSLTSWQFAENFLKAQSAEVAA